MWFFFFFSALHSCMVSIFTTNILTDPPGIQRKNLTSIVALAQKLQKSEQIFSKLIVLKHFRTLGEKAM